jgi:hypothetical protein
VLTVVSTLGEPTVWDVAAVSLDVLVAPRRRPGNRPEATVGQPVDTTPNERMLYYAKHLDLRLAPVQAMRVPPRRCCRQGRVQSRHEGSRGWESWTG